MSQIHSVSFGLWWWNAIPNYGCDVGRSLDLDTKHKSWIEDFNTTPKPYNHNHRRRVNTRMNCAFIQIP